MSMPNIDQPLPHTHVILLQGQASLYYADAIQKRLYALDAINPGDRRAAERQATISADNAASISLFTRRHLGLEE